MFELVFLSTIRAVCNPGLICKPTGWPEIAWNSDLMTLLELLSVGMNRFSHPMWNDQMLHARVH